MTNKPLKIWLQFLQYTTLMYKYQGHFDSPFHDPFIIGTQMTVSEVN